jgi:hypothetical protein
MAIYLRDTNAITDSLVIDTPSGGIVKGVAQQIGSVVGFAFTTATITSTDYENYDEQVTMVTEARTVKFDKATGGGSPTFQKGDTIYYDLSEQKATTESTGNAPVGYAKEIAMESDDYVVGSFNGSLNL